MASLAIVDQVLISYQVLVATGLSMTDPDPFQGLCPLESDSVEAKRDASVSLLNQPG